MDRPWRKRVGFKSTGWKGWIGWGARKTRFKQFLLGPGFLPLPGLPLKRLAAFLRSVMDSRCGGVGCVIDLLHGRVGFLAAFSGFRKLTEHQALCIFAQSAGLCQGLFSFLFWAFAFFSRLEFFLYSNIRNSRSLLIASQLGTSSFWLKSVPTWDRLRTRSQITRNRRVFGRVQVKIDRSSRPG